MRNFIRATMKDEHGRRYPDSWKLCDCDRCDARLKLFRGGRVEDANDDEWKRAFEKR